MDALQAGMEGVSDRDEDRLASRQADAQSLGSIPSQFHGRNLTGTAEICTLRASYSSGRKTNQPDIVSASRQCMHVNSIRVT